MNTNWSWCLSVEWKRKLAKVLWTFLDWHWHSLPTYHILNSYTNAQQKSVFTVQLCLSCIFSRLTNLKLFSPASLSLYLVIQFEMDWNLKFEIFITRASVSEVGRSSILYFKMVCWCHTTRAKSTKRSWCHSKMSFVSYQTTRFFFLRWSLVSPLQQISIHLIHS